MKNIDEELEEMMEADALKACASPLYNNIFRKIEEPWTMKQDPWRAVWVDPVQGEVCEILLLGIPGRGNKYAFFQAFVGNTVYFYVFENSKYFSLEEE